MLFSGTLNGSWDSLRPLTIPYSTGYVGINNASPGYPLDVGGIVNCTTLQGLLAYSYLTGLPSVLSNTSPAFTTVSNASINASNCVNGAAVCATGGLQFPASDPGWMTVANYGGADRYGFGQWAGGQVRAVISGSYSAAGFNVCKPFNSNYTSWSNLLSVDSSGNCSNLGNLNVGDGMVNVTNQLNVQGYLQQNGSGAIGTQKPQLVFFNSAQTASNLVLYDDGSSKFRNGVVIQTAQIFSNVFNNDATFSHLNNHNTTGYALTQSSGGLSTVNATSGNAVRLAVNGALTSSHSANGFQIGADAFAIPSFNQVGSTHVIITNPGGYITFSTVTQGYLDTSQTWGSGTSTCMDQLQIFIKSAVVNPVACMLNSNISRLSGQTATYVQQSFYNNGCSINNYSIPSGSNGIVINMNGITGNPTLYMNWIYQGVL
jgi:hypothetical protein